MSKTDFTAGQEVVRSSDGSVAASYSKGSEGSIMATNSANYGSGHTTLHSDGSSHHHGTHAHSGFGNSSFTRDGNASKK